MAGSRYSGRYDEKSLELRFRDLEQKVGASSTPVTQRVVVQRSTGSTPGATGTTVEEHVRRADPHPQYYLETEAASDLAAIEADITALENRATALESDVADLFAAQPRTLVASGETFLVPEGRQVAVYGTLTVEGEIDVNGELVVHG